MDAHTLELLEFAKVRGLVAGYAACSLGRELALGMLPSADAAVVRRSLKATAEMADLVSRDNGPPLGGLRDIRGVLEGCLNGTLLSAEDLSRISETVFCFARTRIWLDKLPPEPAFPEVRGLGRGVGRFGGLADEIDAAIGPEGKIHDGASDRLKRIRGEIEAFKVQIHDKIRDFINSPRVKDALQFPQATWSGDRFVLPVKADMRGRVPGIVHRTSGSGETVFVEPSPCVELGNAVAELVGQEQQEITRILRELTRKVALQARDMLRTLAVMGDFDLLAAKARFGLEYRCIEPEITSDGTLRLRSARHPLLIALFREADADKPESKRRDVVPVDVHLGEGFDLLLITGPNTGGKTVALKTVGLLSLMAQAGLHIPAGHGARLPVFRHVLADIGDEQSIEQSLSTFSGHVRRIAEVMNTVTSDSLVLLDELGGGTDPTEGAALGRAILDELLRLKCKAMVTTHIGSLKTYAYSVERAENASVEFDVTTLRPTYRLLIGEPGNSNALTIAERLGMNSGVLFRARRYLAESDTGLAKGIEEIQQRRRAAELAKQAADTAAAEAAKTKAEYERKLAEVAGVKKQEESRETWRGKLQPGDKVFVPRFGSTGQFLRWAAGGKTEAMVQVGYMQVRLPIAQVYPPEEAPAGGR
jgi:DNA mismatch repair protein MutS2